MPGQRARACRLRSTYTDIEIAAGSEHHARCAAGGRRRERLRAGGVWNDTQLDERPSLLNIIRPAFPRGTVAARAPREPRPGIPWTASREPRLAFLDPAAAAAAAGHNRTRIRARGAAARVPARVLCARPSSPAGLPCHPRTARRRRRGRIWAPPAEAAKSGASFRSGHVRARPLGCGGPPARGAIPSR